MCFLVRFGRRGVAGRRAAPWVWYVLVWGGCNVGRTRVVFTIWAGRSTRTRSCLACGERSQISAKRCLLVMLCRPLVGGKFMFFEDDSMRPKFRRPGDSVRTVNACRIADGEPSSSRICCFSDRLSRCLSSSGLSTSRHTNRSRYPNRTSNESISTAITPHDSISVHSGSGLNEASFSFNLGRLPLFAFFLQEGEEQGDGVVDVVAGVATDVSASKGGEEDEEEEQEEAFVKDLERERAGTTFSKAKEIEEGESDSDSDDDDEEEEEGDSSSDDEGEGEAEGLEEVAPAAAEKQTEDQEHHELSRVSILLVCTSVRVGMNCIHPGQASVGCFCVFPWKHFMTSEV